MDRILIYVDSQRLVDFVPDLAYITTAGARNIANINVRPQFSAISTEAQYTSNIVHGMVLGLDVSSLNIDDESITKT